MAYVVLVGVRGAAAANALCGAGTITTSGTASLCDCPTGTGVLTAVTGTSATVGTTSYYTATVGTSTAVTTISLTGTGASSAGSVTAAQAAALCTALLPGYRLVPATYDSSSASLTPTPSTLIATCTVTTTYCPGLAGLFSGTLPAGTGITGAGTFSTPDGALVLANSIAFQTTTTTNKFTVANSGTVIPLACGGGGGTMVPIAALTACQSAAGYYLSGSSQTTTTAATTGVACTGSGQTPANSFICPAGTYGTALTVAGLTGEIACQANSQSNSGGSTCIAKAGYYGANDATGTTVTYTACPTGVTTTLGTNSGTGQTALTGCTDLKAGYGFNAGVTSSTSLAALIAPCSTTQYGCGGSAALFVSGPTTTNLGITAAGSMVLASATTLTAAVTTAAVTTGSANVIIGSCPSGVTVAGGNTWTSAGSLIADCTDLAVGWAFNPSITSSTNITALLTQCTAGSYGCAGKTGVFGSLTGLTSGGALGTTGLTIGSSTTANTALSSATAVTTAITTAAANAGANIKGTCPAFATNTFTATSSPTWAATAAAAVSDCTDLVPGYAMSPGIVNTNQDPTVLLDPCTAGTYAPICAGSRGLFTANPVIAVANISYYPGLLSYASSDLVLLLPAVTGNVFGAFGTDSLANAPNSPLLLNTCPTGSTNAGGAAMTSISSCIVKPGYYIDPSALNTPEICPANEYCLGGGAVGTVGGDTVCPTGSVGLATASALSSSINDCVLSAGFYTTSAAINTPVPCLSGFICAGGAALGTAGGVGSVACPTGSTNAACLAPTAPANTTTTVNGAPVTVSPAAVTVSPAAVTVTPAAQPITVNVTVPAPIFSAAPRAAAHAAVLALTALAALVAF